MFPGKLFTLVELLEMEVYVRTQHTEHANVVCKCSSFYLCLDYSQSHLICNLIGQLLASPMTHLDTWYLIKY